MHSSNRTVSDAEAAIAALSSSKSSIGWDVTEGGDAKAEKLRKAGFKDQEEKLAEEHSCALDRKYRLRCSNKGVIDVENLRAGDNVLDACGVGR